MNVRIGLLIPILLLVACSTPRASKIYFSAVQSVPTDRAIVYFYRPNKTFNRDGWAELFINDEKKFPLTNNSYGHVVLAAGEYDIRFQGSQFGTNWWPVPAEGTIRVDAGQEYFIRIEPLAPGTTVTGADGKPVHVELVSVVSWIIPWTNFSDPQTDIRLLDKKDAEREIRSTFLIAQ